MFIVNVIFGVVKSTLTTTPCILISDMSTYRFNDSNLASTLAHLITRKKIQYFDFNKRFSKVYRNNDIAGV